MWLTDALLLFPEAEESLDKILEDSSASSAGIGEFITEGYTESDSPNGEGVTRCLLNADEGPPNTLAEDDPGLGITL